MQPLTIGIEPLAYDQQDAPWLANLKPYTYQRRVYELMTQALSQKETLCLFVVTPTGSGKTLASYAYAINHGLPAFGVYPTNELIRDQERALKPWIAPADDYGLLRIDSKQLDDWQAQLDLKQHATTLERLLNWTPNILTNPDILFYSYFGLYQGPKGLSQRLWALVGQYRLFIFDEFHLYNVKQMADVAFLAASLHIINPHAGRAFLFASATPESPVLPWLRDQLHLPVEVVQGEASQRSDARMIAQPLQLTVLPADLQRWHGGEALLGYLSDIEQFLFEYPQARLVTILDSVAGAIGLAQELRQRFPGTAVGEVHGFTSDQEREAALRSRFTVGTSTIEVGIDFKDETGKDVLIFEARTASQFVQRFGRLARHSKDLAIPNWAIAIVPEYVYHYLTNKLTADEPVTRPALAKLIEEAYQKPEDFSRYLRTHAAAEYSVARQHAESLFMPDDRPRIAADLADAIQVLTGQTGGQAWGKQRGYEREKILAPLLTFRGTSFEAAILDQRGADPGFPARRYNLMFLLRRGLFELMDEEEYRQELERLAERWPQDVAREQRYAKLIPREATDLLGVYGFFRLINLLEKPRRVWFEIDQEELAGRKAQVVVLSGLEIATEPETRLRPLNRHLRKKQVVAWCVDRHPTAIRLGRALPPLFELSELRVRRPGGGISDQPWSIAFNQDAFFVDSLGWWLEKRRDAPIIL